MFLQGIDSLCLKDSYIKEGKSKVSKIIDDMVFLEQTIFYPQGGGQPGDTGYIVTKDEKIRVNNTKRTEHGVAHFIEAPHQLSPGMEVNLIVDWERRYKFMQLHTALHILTAIVLKEWNALVTGGSISEEKARIDFDLDKLDQERRAFLEQRLQEEIAKNREVKVYWLEKEEAMKIPGLIRLKADKLKGIETFRIVEIEGLDIQADGGLHVKRTGEITNVGILKVENKGKGRKRLHIGFKS